MTKNQKIKIVKTLMEKDFTNDAILVYLKDLGEEVTVRTLQRYKKALEEQQSKELNDLAYTAKLNKKKAAELFILGYTMKQVIEAVDLPLFVYDEIEKYVNAGYATKYTVVPFSNNLPNGIQHWDVSWCSGSFNLNPERYQQHSLGFYHIKDDDYNE